MKILKRILIAVVVLAVLAFLFVRLTMHESRPTVVEGNADALAQKMLMAVNKPAWDTLKYVKWTFPRGHSFVWDKVQNDALISWEDYVVHLDMDEVQGKAFKADQELTGDERNKAVQEAWSFWCNDSFWFSAPYKVFDPGTTRQLATDKDGNQGLLITYESGGVTPGDQYLWYLDDNGMPTGYKMWVKIIPVGGVYASWEDYVELKGGARVAQSHVLSIMDMKIDMTDIASGDDWSDLGYNANPIRL